MTLPRSNIDLMLEEFSTLESEYLKKSVSSRPVVGYLCLRVPPELIMAMGCIPRRIVYEYGAEQQLNNLIRTDACSFCRSVPAILKSEKYSDLKAIIAGACCDQMRRLTETTANYSDLPVFFFGASRTWDSDSGYFKNEMLNAFERMGSMLGLTIDPVQLKNHISARSNLVQLINELRDSNSMPPQLLHKIAGSSLPSELIFDFLSNHDLSPIVNERVKILLMGSIPSGKELQIIEESGGSVIADATCMGDRAFRPYSVSDSDSIDLLYNHYVEGNLCPHRRPFTRLIDYVKDLAERREVNGIIYRSVKFCHPYSLSAKRFKEEIGLPMLIIDDDLTLQAVSSFRTRIGAFIEMLEARKDNA